MAWVKIADRSTYWEISNTGTATSTGDYRNYWSIYYDNVPDIANNRTAIKIDYYVQVYNTVAHISFGQTDSSNAKVNGGNNVKNIPQASYPSGLSYFGTTSLYITHDSSGNGSFTWQGVSASSTGSFFNNSTSVTTYYLPQIPRATTINSFTWAKASGGAGLSRLTCNWATAHSIDRIQYSFNGGSWTTVTGSGTSGSFNISSLTPNTQYSMKIKVRRADSQVETESGTLSATTYDIAKITVAPSNNVNMDNAQSITYTNPSGASLETSVYKTDASTVIAGYRGCSGTSYTFNFTSGEKTLFYNQIPTTKTLPLRFYLRTSDGLGNTYLHYAERTFEVFNANPTFTTWTYADTNATTVALTGSNQKIIKGYSNVKATITSANKMVANKGATATSYQLTIGTKPSATVAYSSSTTVEMTVNAVDNNVFNCYAIDSRGNSTNVTKTITTDYINYTPISITSATATRTDDIGEVVTLTYNGTFYNDSFGSTTNTIKSATYKYKKTTESTYTDGEADSITPTPSGNTFSFSGAIKGDKGALGFDATYSYNVQVIVTDELSTKTFTFLLGSGTPNIAIAQGGIAINQAYDETLGGALQVNGPIYVNSKLLLDIFYPIGTIYETTSSNLDTTTKMNTYFGGTWAAFGTGRMLIGVDASNSLFNTVEETGGSQYLQAHIHSASSGNQSASHTHSGTTNNTGAHTHNVYYYIGATSGSVRRLGNANSNSGSDNSALSGGNHQHTMTTGNQSASHNHTITVGAVSDVTTGTAGNLPPYIAVYRYRRTA